MKGLSLEDLARFTNRTRARSTAAAMSRRSLLRGATAGGLAVAGAGALSACGVQGHVVPAGAKATGQAGKDYSATEKKLVWATWPAYIDIDDKHPSVRPTLDAFEKQTGRLARAADGVAEGEESRLGARRQAIDFVPREHREQVHRCQEIGVRRGLLLCVHGVGAWCLLLARLDDVFLRPGAQPSPPVPKSSGRTHRSHCGSKSVGPATGRSIRWLDWYFHAI